MLLRFETEADWLAARKQDITSTEISSMLGLNPYKSRYRLWHEKKGNVEPDFVENRFTIWGKRLQMPVAIGICEDNGWEGEDLSFMYLRDPERRNGASMDIRAIDKERGAGIVEIKTCRFFDEDAGWTKAKAPIWYECQLQNQLHLALKDGQDIRWGAIGALSGDKESRVYHRQYDKEFGALVDTEAEKFWRSIEQNEEPTPDYKMDSDTIRKLQGEIQIGEVANLTGNNEAHAALASYGEITDKFKEHSDLAKQYDDERKALKVKLHHLAGAAERIQIGEITIGCKETVVAPFQNAGYSYRRFDLPKTKKAKG